MEVCRNHIIFATGMKISPRFMTWLRRVGWIGFFFFLAKGIVWLVAGKFIVDWLKGVF
jgi:hypothetical protein